MRRNEKELLWDGNQVTLSWKQKRVCIGKQANIHWEKRMKGLTFGWFFYNYCLSLLSLISMMMLVKTIVLGNENSCYLPFLIISKHGSLEMNEQEEIKWQKGINPKKSIKLHMAIIYTIYLLTYSLTPLAYEKCIERKIHAYWWRKKKPIKHSQQQPLFWVNIVVVRWTI